MERHSPRARVLLLRARARVRMCRIRRLGIAPGLDALPHLEMWKDLPFLVRDGVIFSIDTIKSKAAPNYQAVL